MISLKLKGTCKYKVLVNGQGRNNSETQRFTQGEPQEMDPVSLQTEEQTNIPVALPPSPVIQDQVWHARQAGMCKAVCSSACCLGSFVCFFTRTLQPRVSVRAAEGELDSPEHRSCAIRNRGWNQKWVCSLAHTHTMTQPHMGFHGSAHRRLFSMPSSGCSVPPDLC